MRVMSQIDILSIIIRCITNRDMISFPVLIRHQPELIIVPDEKGFTILHHLAKNVDPKFEVVLRDFINLAIKNGISKESLLNKTDPSGRTALTLCVICNEDNNNYNLPARIGFILELLNQGADPTIGNLNINVLNRFSVNDKNKIRSCPVLTKYIRECHKKIVEFALEQRRQAKIKPQEEYLVSLRELSLTCADQKQKTSIDHQNTVSESKRMSPTGS
jgi:hypothetical protein